MKSNTEIIKIDHDQSAGDRPAGAEYKRVYTYPDGDRVTTYHASKADAETGKNKIGRPIWG